MLKHARGQHRRNKRTSTLAITGLTTAMLAGGGLLAAVPASAATGWDAVAQCESGGNAKYNDGQFYGLFNFDRGTWNGTGRSGTADQYSAAEQLAAAEQLYSQRGSSPWPVCGKYLSGGSTASAPAASRSQTRTSVAVAPTKPTTSTQAAASTSSAVAYLSQRYVGTYRADVRTLQQKLVANGHHIAVDGRYGPETEGAVRSFQQEKGLMVDGMAGPQTQHACGMI
jgi:Transglycosylase-like domain/Putative peptidoglycan binding domain